MKPSVNKSSGRANSCGTRLGAFGAPGLAVLGVFLRRAFCGVFSTGGFVTSDRSTGGFTAASLTGSFGAQVVFSARSSFLLLF